MKNEVMKKFSQQFKNVPVAGNCRVQRYYSLSRICSIHCMSGYKNIENVPASSRPCHPSRRYPRVSPRKALPATAGDTSGSLKITIPLKHQLNY